MGPLGASGDVLEVAWKGLGRAWIPLGVEEGRLGGVLGGLEGLGGSCGLLGALGGPLGGSREASWDSWGASWAVLGHLGRHLVAR